MPIYECKRNQRSKQMCLEAQQRYFSYCATLVAIVSQNYLVFVFVGYRKTVIARYIARWGITQMCLCETMHRGGLSHHFGELSTFAHYGLSGMVCRSASLAIPHRKSFAAMPSLAPCAHESQRQIVTRIAA